ncbi:hypothetical protein FEM48_Zijuj08G0034900 [Ziziphus jujuba var. spinosa]|uniref:Uncharacterized protein n=1 Tax=Ziziphus jujuba var. spinosa TaxID=714518 RepID=A0A978UWR1_ZIZJJ|nr:hypothetical protein FEM48_Zijuj08G0034900 [Ziziphus jujuba var. spinosa]
MWAASIGSSPGPCHSLIPKPTKPRRRLIGPLVLSVPVNSQPPDQNIQGLGRTSRTTIDSSTKPTNPIEKQDEGEEEEEGRQISGSDVLWAMQKAAAHKNRVSGMKKKKKKKNKMKKSKGSSSSHVEQEVAIDYSNVRPLSISSDWGGRLDELEKLLQELSSERI